MDLFNIFNEISRCLYFYFIWMFLLCGRAKGIDSETSATYCRRQERKLNPLDITDETTTRSLLECGVLCVPNPSCDKFAWNNDQKMCQLGTTNLLYGKLFGSRLVSDLQWTSYENMKYPVVLYHGPDGLSTLTFNEAEDLCVAMGTTIASRQTLLQAKNMGYAQCACGWLSNGTNGFVMQEQNNPSCSSYLTDGIQDCNHAVADVYCHVQ